MGKAASLAADIPFIGRVAERAELVRGLRHNPGAAYVIAGSAGWGKSRLAAEVAGEFAASGWRVVRVMSTRALRSVPFGAFAAVLAEMNVADNVGAVLQRTAAMIGNWQQAGRVLFVVDDAHTLDDCSAALVLHLVQVQACPVLVTLRTPSEAPDPITMLWKDEHAARLDLRPLISEELEAMAAAALRGPVAAPTLRWLVTASEGNPLYARELLIGAIHSGALAESDGLWVVRQPMPSTPRLVDLIGHRLGDLSEPARDVVDLLALGEPLEYEVIAAVCGDDAVAEADRAGVIVARSGLRRQVTALSHPLFGEVRRQHMGDPRSRRLARQLLDAFPASAEPSGDELLRIACWQLLAGGDVDPVLLREAATLARKMDDFELSARLAQASVEGGGGPKADLTLAEALLQSGNAEQAGVVLERAAREATDEDDVASVAAIRSHVYGTMLNDRGTAEAVLAEALERVNSSAERLVLLDARNTFALFAAQPDLNLSDSLILIDAADAAVSSRAAISASIAYAFLGDLKQAQAISARGLRVRRANRLSAKREQLQLMGPLLALRGAGRLDDAEQLARTATGPAQAQAGDVVATFEHLSGMLLVDRGRVRAAERLFRDSLVFNREHNDPGPVRWCLGGLVLSRALAGDIETAESALAELDSAGPTWMTMFDLDLLDRGRAWLAAQRGERGRARSLLQAASERARYQRCQVAEAFLLHDMVRLDGADAVVERLAELAELVDGPLIATFAMHAGAVAEDDGPALEVAANHFERLGALLLAAEAGTQVAAHHRRSGDPRKAVGWQRHVEQLLPLCDQARTPALADGGALSVLTRREREIVSLAAAGASSRTIADQLVLSVRTVDNHLHRAYDKLGVRGRDELAAVEASL